MLGRTFAPESRGPSAPAPAPVAMGHQEDRAIGCTSTPGCPGQKSVVYVYDDHGNCISQTAYPCSVCGH